MARPKDPKTSTVTDESGLPRRDFLRLSLGGAALIAGCGDDGLGGASETDGESSSTSGGTGETTGGETTTTTDATSGSSSSSSDTSTTTGDETTGTTVDPTTTTTGDTTGVETTGTTTGEDLCAGELVEFDPESIALDEVLFPLAVMVGEMKTTSVMFAVFVADASPKTLRIWRTTDDPGVVDMIHEEEVVPDAEGYTKLSVEGLCPGTWYRYGYFEGGPDEFTARSLLGEFRTAIDDDVLEPLTIAMTACNGSDLDWPALDYTAEEYYDLFIHLGDMAYNDGSETLAEYRASWRKYLSVGGFKKVYSRSGLYATWDDHEIDDNSNFDRETMDPQELQRRQNAMDSYFELMPIDAEGPSYRLWRSFRWGLTAEFIVLDCRYERRPSMDQYISPQQMMFLKDRMLNSPCHFKVIVNSVPITNMPTVWDVAANDRWEGYPAQRQEVLDFINDNNVENVWFLSGDFHVTFVSRLEPDGMDLASRTREIAITGGNENPIPEFLTGLNQPQFDYGRHKARGCVITFDPMANAVNVRFIDPENGEDVYNESLTQD
ncbi:MAG: alkaline phosphatase D family protein [Myxococcales bacterium]|nr:alkaline phosphatase D family protein [Myxococcales bacterium]